MSSISGPLLRVPHKSSTNGDEGFGTATVTWWRTIASGCETARGERIAVRTYGAFWLEKGKLD